MASRIDPSTVGVSVAYLLAGGLALAAVASGTGPGAAALVTGLGINLLSNALAFFCRPETFQAKSTRQEVLANHDILRMVRTAWGESAIATVRSYAAAYPAPSQWRPIQLFQTGSSPELLDVLNSLTAEDFTPQDVSAQDLHDAIEESRLSLLPSQNSPAEAANVQEAQKLRNRLVTGVIEVVRNKLDSSGLHHVQIPGSFKAYLDGSDDKLRGGILQILSCHIALYLKTDSRAQTAILHSALQELITGQGDIERSATKIKSLCEEIQSAQDQNLQTIMLAFEAHVERLGRQVSENVQAALASGQRPLLIVPYRKSGQSPSTDAIDRLTYRERTTPMIGRDAAMQALFRFINDSRDALWTVISGEAGTGKSRLAAELVAALRGDEQLRENSEVPPGRWRAGFLREYAWLGEDGLRWRPDADTLIVIDYAGQLAVTGAQHLSLFLEYLYSRPQEEALRCRVRVLLLDRLPPDSEQGVATQLTRGTTAAVAIKRIRWQPSAVESTPFISSESNPLHLRPLQSASALEIVFGYADRSLSEPEKFRVRDAISRDPDMGRPLFAALIGSAIGRDQLPAGELNPVTVALTALSWQFSHWRVKDLPLLETAKNLLAVATAGQGAEEEALLSDDQVLGVVFGRNGVSDDEVAELRRTMGLICAVGENGRVQPLEPDFLGELFVLDRMLKYSLPRASGKAEGMMRAAWNMGENAVGFVIRLAGDFATRPEQVAAALTRGGQRVRVERVEQVLRAILMSATVPDSLARGSEEALPYIIHRCALVSRFDLAGDLWQAMLRANVSPGNAALACFAYALSGDIQGTTEERSEQALGALLRLHQDYPEAAVREWLAKALFNRSLDLGNGGDLEASGHLTDELRQLHHDYPELAVREPLVGALVRRGENLADENPSEAQLILSELLGLARDHPDDELLAKIAQALNPGDEDLNRKSSVSN